jgi:uroporphyrinogen-III synthase
MTPRVLVTRATQQADDLVSALRGVGVDALLVPTIAVELVAGGGDLDTAARHLPYYTWVVITSTNGARAILKAAERVFTPFEASRFAAIGSATGRALEVDGVDVDFQPSQSTSATLAAELPVRPRDRVLVIRGDLSGVELSATLRARGAEVDDVIAYRTKEAPDQSRALLRTAVASGPIAAAVFTSGSTVRGLVALARQESIDVRSIPAVCIGTDTSDSARAAGFRILAVASSPDPVGIARATAEALALQVQEAT